MGVWQVQLVYFFVFGDFETKKKPAFLWGEKTGLVYREGEPQRYSSLRFNINYIYFFLFCQNATWGLVYFFVFFKRKRVGEYGFFWKIFLGVYFGTKQLFETIKKGLWNDQKRSKKEKKNELISYVYQWELIFFQKSTL